MIKAIRGLSVLFLVIVFLSSTAFGEMVTLGDNISEEETETVGPGGGKILDLGEPTPGEKGQMEREAEHEKVEESGFDEASSDTMEEMAGDYSDIDFGFGLDN
ncbi:MAG: hypothetical protein ABIH57_03330 [Candidatus Omnitrophota bacterium]